nr:type I restriction endonuclease [Helicobacter pylori]
MIFKKAIIAYLPCKTHGKYREKKIIFFAITKPLKGALKTPIKTQKGAYYLWKTKTLKRIHLLH